MNYSLSNISSRDFISEPIKLYEVDLVKQWLNITPGTLIETVNHGTITVINAGLRNRNEGPDIKNATLLINGSIINGPIECHLCTTDWYKHKHQNNSAYKSVILHVVRDINNGIIAPEIPTVLLKVGINNYFECSLNDSNKSSYLYNIIIHNSYPRWLDKINIYDGYHGHHKQLLTILVNNSFRVIGAGGNEEQFLRLASKLRFEKLQYLNENEIEKYLREKSLTIKWVKRGIRPAQQPSNRFKLASEIIHYFLNLDIEKLPILNNVNVFLSNDFIRSGGLGIQTELLGNIILPFYAARSLYIHNTTDYKKYHEIWNQLKISNAYRKFVKRFGNILHTKQLKSFSVLQGLIAIDNNWCSNNLCHLCPLKGKIYADN